MAVGRFLAVAAATGLFTASSASAAIMLPPGAIDLRLDGRAAFDTSIEPRIDVQTGALVSVGDPPVSLLGFGKVATIYDDATEATGTFTGQLTGVLTGTITDSQAFVAGATSTSIKYVVFSNLDVELNVYYDADNDVLVMPDHFGQPAVVPAEATQGDLWLTLTGTATSLLEIEYFRPDANSDFNSFSIAQQTFSGSNFTVTGGTFADQVIEGGSVLASQFGPFSAMFGTEDFDGVTVNAPVDALVQATFEFGVTIPEPASLALMGIGGLLLMGRTRSA
ncbi:MAG: PEP-CTERM sorting domain-containing protein [Phycisphaeraceae bacterium]|nr:PEP-CTERM sorting domain-containing protein [Phycisphaeraceae bacterium]